MTVSHPMFYLDNDEVIISNAEVTMVEQGACDKKQPAFPTLYLGKEGMEF